MIDLAITEPFPKPTDWLNERVVVEEPNRKLWVCFHSALSGKQLNVNCSMSLLPTEFFLKYQEHIIFQNLQLQ